MSDKNPEIDINDVDWKDTAETLQRRVDELESYVEQSPSRYPYEEEDVIVLGPGIFSDKEGKVINWEGINFYREQAMQEPQGEPIMWQSPDLRAYKDGEKVQVIKNGDWVDGFVQERRTGLLHVHTDRGPATVQNPNVIRKSV